MKRHPGSMHAGHRRPSRDRGTGGVHLLLVWTAALALGCSAAPPRSPNVLLITIDTLRADRLGTYGYRRPTSPNLDRLLEGAVVFDDAQTVAPWTLPAFASLMTGHPPSTHRCMRFDSILSPVFDTLAERLQDAGYETAAIVSHILLASDYGLAQGFTDYDETLVQEDARASHLAISSEALSTRAIARLEGYARSPEQPFLLWVHYFDPHWFYHRHEAVQEAFRHGPSGRDDEEIAFTDPHVGPLLDLLGLTSERYDEEIAFTDMYVGRLLDHLATLDLAENTIVVLVADHGEEFFEHGYNQHGRSLYEAAVRVPFAIRVPGLAARRVPGTVSLIDFLPTLLDLLSIPHDDELPGRSLVGLMRGESATPRPALLESRLHHREDADLEGWVTERWKLVVEWPKSEDPLVLRTVDGPTRTLLFDREADPGERTDVSAAHPETVERMRRALAEARIRAEQTAEERLGPRDSAPVRTLPEDHIEHLRALGYVESDGDVQQGTPDNDGGNPGSPRR